MKCCTQIISWESWIKRSRFTRLVHLWPRNETEFRYARLPLLRFHIHSGNDDEKQRTRSALSEFRDYSIPESRWKFRFPLNFAPKRTLRARRATVTRMQRTTNEENGVRSYSTDFLYMFINIFNAQKLQRFWEFHTGRTLWCAKIYLHEQRLSGFAWIFNFKNYAIA